MMGEKVHSLHGEGSTADPGRMHLSDMLLKAGRVLQVLHPRAQWADHSLPSMAGLHVFPVGGTKPETCPTGGAHGLKLHRPGQLEQRRIMVSLGVKLVFFVCLFLTI